MLCLHAMHLALLVGSIAERQGIPWHPCPCPAAQLRAHVMSCDWATGAAVAALAGPALRRMEQYQNLQITDSVAAGHGARLHPAGSPQLQAGDRRGKRLRWRAAARALRKPTAVGAGVSPVHAGTLSHVFGPQGAQEDG